MYLAIKHEDGLEVVIGPGLFATRNGTAVREVLEKMRVGGVENVDSNDYRLVMLNPDGTVMTEDAVVTTNCRVHLVHLNDGASLDEVTVVMLGDTLNTGRMSLTQVVRTAHAYIGIIELTGADFLAAAFTGGDEITLTDVVREAALYRYEIMY